MNPTVGYLFQHLHSAWSTRPAAIRAHVLADLRAAPPAPGEPFHGQRALAMRAGGSATNFPYYLPQTMLSLGLAVATAAAAWLCRAVAEPGVWSQGLVLALTLASVICLWQALGRRFGPAFIDRQRLADAQASLQRSGDGQSRPLGVAESMVIALVFGLDGFLMAFTLTQELFSSVLTPKQAIGASLAISLVSSFLLYELTRFAALESARNHRRRMIRALLASPNAADRERAEAMIASIGAQLDFDFSQSAHRTRPHWALAAVVLALSIATLTVRVHSERQVAAEDDPQVAEERQ
jgi:hypothetical protein